MTGALNSYILRNDLNSYLQLYHPYKMKGMLEAAIDYESNGKPVIAFPHAIYDPLEVNKIMPNGYSLIASVRNPQTLLPSIMVDFGLVDNVLKGAKDSAVKPPINASMAPNYFLSHTGYFDNIKNGHVKPLKSLMTQLFGVPIVTRRYFTKLKSY